MSKQSAVAAAIGGILAEVHRTPPLDCERWRVYAVMAWIPGRPGGGSGAVSQVTPAMAGTIGLIPRLPKPSANTPHPQPLSSPSPFGAGRREHDLDPAQSPLSCLQRAG